MYPVSQDYLDKLMAVGGKRRRLRGYVDSIPFDEDDIVAESLSITDKCVNSNDINLGGVFIGQLEMTFLPSFKVNVPRGTWKDRCISMSIGLLVDEDEDIWEDVPIKPFYIQEANHSKKGISITAYDAMNDFDKNLNLDTTSGEPYDFAALACQNCGVTLGMTQAQMEALPNGDEILGVYPTNDMDTWRDFISYIAATIGGFATIDRTGSLVFRTWHDEPDIEIDMYHRELSGSWSDFTTYYTGLSVVDMDTETTQYYNVEPDTGLTMKLGNNPLLQYGTNETKTRQREAILDALQSFVYTPFSSLSFIDPCLDLGDVISYVDGLAGDESICCVHKIVYTFRKGVKVTGFGKNPALFGAQSKTDKNIAGLLSKADENVVVTHTYENAAQMELDEDIQYSIIKIRFATINAKVVKLLNEIQLDATITAQDGIMTAKAYCYLNDDLLAYSPEDSWDNDGRHMMHLIYWVQNLAGGQQYTWEVALKLTGGTATIDRGWINAMLEAQGLVAVDAWDGVIDIEDEYSLSINGGVTFGYSDSVSFDWHDVETINVSDNYSLSINGGITFRYSDSVDILTQKQKYNIISSDGQYGIASSDGDYYLDNSD